MYDPPAVCNMFEIMGYLQKRVGSLAAVVLRRLGRYSLTAPVIEAT